MKHSVEKVKLANGVNGLLINVPGSEIIASEIWFNSGFRFSSNEKYEMPHITEHLLVGANQDYPDSIAFKQEIEKNGAAFNAATSDHFNWYLWNCAEFEVGRILDLAHSQLTKPLISNKDVTTEKSRVKEELEGFISDHFGTVADLIDHAWEGHPRYRARIGQLSRITATDMKSYYRRTHTQQNATFFAAGAITSNRPLLLKKFEKITSALPQGERQDFERLKRKKLEGPIFENRAIPQIYYRLGFVTGASEPEEWAAGSLLVNLLQSFLPSSLYQEVYRQGLAYHISSGFGYDNLETGFRVTGMVTPENAVKLFQTITKKLNYIKAGKITVQELAATKKIALGQSKLRYQTPGSLLNFYSDDFLLFGSTMSIEEWLALKDSVTGKDLSQIAQKVTQTPDWCLSLVGPVEERSAQDLYQEAQQLS